MSEPNVVTDIVELEEARRRLPELARRVGILRSATAALKETLLTLQREPPQLVPDPARTERLERTRRAAEERFHASLAAVNELGAYVKDPEIGLVDFYSWRDGELVFLCWHHGEEDITSWHGLDEGFAGRKPVE